MPKRQGQQPLQTRIGLVLPGLGHLAVGEWLLGIGLLSLDALLIWSAASGLPRLHEVLFSRGVGSLAFHPVIAVVAWFALAAGLWWAAYRRAWPRQLSADEYNSNRQIFLRSLRQHRTGMFGLFGILFLLAMTFLTPFIAPFDPDAIDMGPKNLAPTWLSLAPTFEYLMGTDEYGRDVFSRLLYGGRISLSIGFVAVSITATVGTSLGAIAAFSGGVVDKLIMWFTDMLLSLPRLVLLLTIVGLFRVQGTKGIFLIIIILGLTGWMGVCRIVRSQVLSLKQEEFIQAAHALGLSDTRIVFRHLIPNAMAPVIVYCSLAIGSTMLVEAALSFLGLGVPPPTSTWGVMVNDGRDPLRIAWWIATFPGLAIVMAVMSFNLLGDGLRDALDPKLR